MDTIIFAIVVIIGFFAAYMFWYLRYFLLVGFLILFVVLIIKALLKDGKSGADSSADARRDGAENRLSASNTARAFKAQSFMMTSGGGRAARRHSGRCEGDCANCPPHYGYRYGRWYYGRCHVHGCRFGGNCGSGAWD